MAKKNSETVIAPVVTEKEVDALVEAIEPASVEEAPATAAPPVDVEADTPAAPIEEEAPAPTLAEIASEKFEGDFHEALGNTQAPVDIEVFAIEKVTSLLARNGGEHFAEELIITVVNHNTVRVAVRRKEDGYTVQVANGRTAAEALFTAYGQVAVLKGITV